MNQAFRPRALAIVGFLVLSGGLAGSQDAAPQDRARAEFDRQGLEIRGQLRDLGARLRRPDQATSQVERMGVELDEVRQRSEDLWRTAQEQLNAASSQLNAEVATFNAEAARLAFESIAIGSRIDLFNNLGTYTTRARFEENLARLSQDWELDYGNRLRGLGPAFEAQRARVEAKARESFGIDLKAAGLARVDAANPYATRLYAKYYGPDGRLVAESWRRDAGPWDRYRAEVESNRARLASRKLDIDRRAQAWNRFREQFIGDRREIARQIRELNALVE